MSSRRGNRRRHPSTALITFAVRAGMSNAGTLTLNGVAGGRLLGGVLVSSISVTEFKA